MTKKLIFGLIMACLAQIWAPNFFFMGIRDYTLLQAIIICNVKENVWSSKLKKNDKKPHFGLDLDPLGPKSGHQFFFSPKKSGFVSH